MELKNAIQNLNNSMSDSYERNLQQMLDRFGLEQKRSTMEVVLPALGIFGAGIACGAALGILFAPKRGEELRTDLRHRLDDIRERGFEEYEELKARGEEAVERGRQQVSSQKSGNSGAGATPPQP